MQMKTTELLMESNYNDAFALIKSYTNKYATETII